MIFSLKNTFVNLLMSFLTAQGNTTDNTTGAVNGKNLSKNYFRLLVVVDVEFPRDVELPARFTMRCTNSSGAWGWCTEVARHLDEAYRSNVALSSRWI